MAFQYTCDTCGMSVEFDADDPESIVSGWRRHYDKGCIFVNSPTKWNQWVGAIRGQG